MEQRIALLSVADYGDKIGETVGEAVKLVGGIESVVESGDRVLVKPNLVNARRGEDGDVTHFSLIGPVIKMCYEAGAEEILVGDGSGEVETPRAFATSGMKEVVDHLRLDGIPVRFVDLNYDRDPKTGEFNKVSLGEVGLNRDFVYRIAHSVLVADTIISVPKLKTHTRVGVSAALKNFVGIAPSGHYGFPKWRGGVEVLPHGPYDASPVIQQTILDLDRIALGRYLGSFKERKHLAIADGVVAGVYHKTNPKRIPIWKPARLGAIIVGTDPVAVDTVSAKVLCYCPDKIELISRAATLGLGTANNIQTVGERVEDIRRFVPPPHAFLHIADKTVRGVRGRIYRQALKKTAGSILRRARVSRRSMRN